MTTTPPLPKGFQVVKFQASSEPSLPEGFQLVNVDANPSQKSWLQRGLDMVDSTPPDMLGQNRRQSPSLPPDDPHQRGFIGSPEGMREAGLMPQRSALSELGRGISQSAVPKMFQRHRGLTEVPPSLERPAEGKAGTAGEFLGGVVQFAPSMFAPQLLGPMIAGHAAEEAQRTKEETGSDAAAIGSATVTALTELLGFKIAGGVFGRKIKENVGELIMTGSSKQAAKAIGNLAAASGSFAATSEIGMALDELQQAALSEQRTLEEAWSRIKARTPDTLVSGAVNGAFIGGGGAMHAGMRAGRMRSALREQLDLTVEALTTGKNPLTGEPLPGGHRRRLEIALDAYAHTARANNWRDITEKVQIFRETVKGRGQAQSRSASSGSTQSRSKKVENTAKSQTAAAGARPAPANRREAELRKVGADLLRSISEGNTELAVRGMPAFTAEEAAAEIQARGGTQTIVTEMAAKIVSEAPEAAVKLAEKQQPSRGDMRRAGVDRVMSAADRVAVANRVREMLASQRGSNLQQVQTDTGGAPVPSPESVAEQLAPISHLRPIVEQAARAYRDHGHEQGQVVLEQLLHESLARPDAGEDSSLSVQQLIGEFDAQLRQTYPQTGQGVPAPADTQPVLTQSRRAMDKIYISFDATKPVPEPAELKQRIANLGFETSIVRFDTDLIAGTQGNVRYRIDVFDDQLRASEQRAAELQAALTGADAPFRSQSEFEKRGSTDERLTATMAVARGQSPAQSRAATVPADLSAMSPAELRAEAKRVGVKIVGLKRKVAERRISDARTSAPATGPQQAERLGATKPARSQASHRDAPGTPQTDHGLPQGVRVRGKHFAAELLEATRRIKATARYARLHKGTLGRWRRTAERDMIELGDIRNQRTLAHELGHAIDFAMFDRVAGQSIVNRVGSGVGERLLREELKRVSYLYRGDPSGGGRSHVAYRHSGNELMADFFAMLIHDPALTRQLAPRMSEMIEAKLADSPEIRTLIHELHAEKVTPTGPRRAGKTSEPVEPADALPPAATKSAKEPAAKRAAEQLTTESVRTLAAKTNRAFQVANNWMEKLSEKQLEDIGAAVEGVGNLRIKSDSIEAVRQRMTPAMERVLKDYRFQQELARQEVNKFLEGTGEKEYVRYIDDYLAHFYTGGKKARQGKVSRWIKNSPNAAKRTLPTLQEAVEMGMTPTTQNAAKLFKMWAEINWRVAVNRNFVHQLRHITTLDGDPVIQPAGKAPSDWVRIDHPAIQQVFARKVSDSTTMLWRGGAAVHPDVAPAVQQMLGEPFSRGWVRGVETFNAYAKKAALSLSFFHHGALTESAQAVLGRWWNPFRGVLVVGEKDPTTGRRVIAAQPHRLGVKLMKDADFLEDAAAHGLVLQASSDTPIHRIQKDLAKIEAKTRHIPGLGLITRAVRGFNQEWDLALWDRYHNGLKAFSYHALVEQWTKNAPPGVSEKRIKETVASLLNDAYGGQEWQTKFWLSPEGRRLWHQVQLAPDWTYSNLAIFGKTFTSIRDPIRRTEQLRYWRNMLLTLAGGHIAAQWALFQMFGDEDKGDHPWMWQNEKGRRFDVDVTPLRRRLPWHDPDDDQRYYVSLGKQAKEILNWFSDPLQTLRRKASPAVHVAYEQITGSQGEGFDAPFSHVGFWEGLPERGVSIVEKFKPFSFSDNNFAFTAPLRKGMTPWKAGRAIESTLELYAEPSLIRHIARDGASGALAFANTPEFTTKLDGLVTDVLDAAQANGHDPDMIFRRSLTTVRSKYYRDFFAAMEAEDDDAMRRSAEAIVKLHGGVPNLIRSAKNRGIELTFDDGQLMKQYMRDATQKLRWKDDE